MRMLVVSPHRLAALGLVALAEKCGIRAEVGSLDQVLERPLVDLVLVYSDRWDHDCRAAADVLHDAPALFAVVLGAYSSKAGTAATRGGAIEAFAQSDEVGIQTFLTNTERFFRSRDSGLLVLANGFLVDLAAMRLERDGHYFPLTPQEYKMLTVLGHPAETWPHEPVALQEIARAIWGAADAGAPSTLRGYIRNLRAKIEDDPDHPTVLCSRRRAGYWLELRDDLLP